MKKCPRCGATTFHVTAHVTQDWEVDAEGTFLRCIDDAVETTHYPNDDDIWDCASCGYSAAGSRFNVVHKEGEGLDFKNTISWRNDRVTRKFVEDVKYDLAFPKSMAANELCETMTYIRGNRNPYAEELCRRAGLQSAYLEADSEKALYDIGTRAAKAFNITLV